MVEELSSILWKATHFVVDHLYVYVGPLRLFTKFGVDWTPLDKALWEKEKRFFQKRKMAEMLYDGNG